MYCGKDGGDARRGGIGGYIGVIHPSGAGHDENTEYAARQQPYTCYYRAQFARFSAGCNRLLLY